MKHPIPEKTCFSEPRVCVRRRLCGAECRPYLKKAPRCAHQSNDHEKANRAGAFRKGTSSTRQVPLPRRRATGEPESGRGPNDRSRDDYCPRAAQTKAFRRG